MIIYFKGPLTYKNISTGKTNIVGIASWGNGCALPGMFDIEIVNSLSMT